MHRSFSFILISIIILSALFCASCKENFDPGKEAEKNRNKIIQSAPIQSEYEIEKPKENLPENIRAFSGHWVGKWNDLIPSQLIVTKISSNEITFIYSWGANPQRGVESGVIKGTTKLDDKGRIKYDKEDLSLTFAVDTLLNKVIGVSVKGEMISNIVMEKVDN
ncbi:hypothetical protein ASZ90_003555 [hydrocarbon metagenome]|uniref:Uncharacterized protein n=1 Tax=hydrocarbon metagenome TaxID=938273 RepID=A0A0W8G0L1_9ZZZZ